MGVFSFRIIDYLDIFKDLLPCLITDVVGFKSDSFTLEQVVKALGYGIAVVVSTSAHTWFERLS
jgi:hypothetical protein